MPIPDQSGQALTVLEQDDFSSNIILLVSFCMSFRKTIIHFADMLGGARLGGCTSRGVIGPTPFDSRDVDRSLADAAVGRRQHSKIT